MDEEKKELEVAAVWVDLNMLTEWADNPRKNQPVEEVARSIERFGFAAPIIARNNGEIVAGHTRFKAARDILKLDRVPVRYMDLDPADARLLALADNKIAELALWDDEKLFDVIKKLREEQQDLSGLGWSDDEIQGFVDEVPTFELEEQPDPIDENQHDTIPDNIEPRTKDGDIITIGDHVLHCGDCIEVLKRIDDNHIDAIVCDPPYGIGFMSKGWDCSVPSAEWAKECFRVLKPGGHLVAFGATRTIHRLTVCLEDANFEIRDQIAWCYFSGFPKSHDVSKAIDKHFGAEREVIGPYIAPDGKERGGSPRAVMDIANYKKGDRREHNLTAPSTEEAKRFDGYGTALKPAYEPAVLARKPLTEKNIAENVLEWGTGGINIDDCRFGYGDPCWVGPQDCPKDEQIRPRCGSTGYGKVFSESDSMGIIRYEVNKKGRWPANLYQCPKASRKEREEGCVPTIGRIGLGKGIGQGTIEGREEIPLRPKTGAETVNRKEGSAGLNNPRAGAGRTASTVYNIHPTVKPVRVMRWLCRLLAPPNNPIILDTFCGSGTTMIAAELEGFRSIGIERQPEYCDIIRARLEHARGGNDA